MNIKTFALVLTLVLLAFGGYFLVEYYQTCYRCNPELVHETTGQFEAPDIVFAIANFTAAVFSIILLTKRKFSASAIVSGVMAGLQVVAVGSVMLLNI